MSNRAAKRLVPELRFPEFREGSAWRLHALGSVGKTVSGLSGKSAEDFGKGSPFVTYKQVFDNSFVAFDKCGLVRIENGERQNDVAYGDVLITGSSETPDEVGFASVVLEKPFEKTYLNSFCFAFRSDTPLLCVPRFSQFLFHSPWYRAKVGHLAQGSTRFNISKLGFLKLKLPIPTQYEQQKIADCLSSLDDLITAQAQKIEALKGHKRGLMQQLLPAEGETVPRLRLPEFRDATAWEKRKLEELAKRGSGHTPSKSNAEYYDGGIKWVSLADTSRLDNGLILDTAKEVSALGIKNSSAVLHPAGAVILSRDAGVGKSAVIGCPMAVSQHFIAWVCHPSQLHNWFLYYVLQNRKTLFERVATGSTIKTIGLPFFMEMLIAVPSLPEQQKIADCLASLDELITAQAQKLATLKTFKQGLMQQLFPTIDESTA